MSREFYLTHKRTDFRFLKQQFRLLVYPCPLRDRNSLNAIKENEFR